MAENRNRHREAGWANEGMPGDEAQASWDREVQMPPRNILETDSAKFTAEFVKGVVKGLYTSEPEYNYGYDEAEHTRTPARSDYVYGEPGGERVKKPYPQDLKPHKSELSFEPAYEQDSPPQERHSEQGRAREQRPEPKMPKKPDWDYEEIEAAPPRKPEPATEPPRRRRETSFEIPEDDELASDGFLKAYEEKNHREKPSFSKKPSRRTFSSLSSDENPSELEGILSGRSAKKPPASHGSISPSFKDKDEEYVYIKQESYPKAPRAYEQTQPVEPAKRHHAPEKEERSEYQAVDFELEQRQEKIPLIINKRIESKPKKTADDYRGVSKNEYDKTYRNYSASSSAISGANIFAAVFMAVAIIIIGILVWKVNSLSKGSGQFDADEVTSLREQNTLLAKNIEELESKNSSLTNENDRLREENMRLLAADVPEEEPPEATPAEPVEAPAPEGLVDGYYTVQKGDTLWKISEKFLGNGDKYAKIATENNLDPSQSLYTGLRLKIPKQ